MPIYEYQCERCDEVWEEIRHTEDRDAPARCPVCTREGVRIMSRGTRAILKGTCWAWDGYTGSGER